MNDSALYTGIDGEPKTGQFGNEVIDRETAEKIHDQTVLIKELTPKLQSILDMIENERADVIEAIADFIERSDKSEEVNSSEIKAAARYRKYLDVLKTKFTLALNETKNRG